MTAEIFGASFLQESLFLAAKDGESSVNVGVVLEKMALYPRIPQHLCEVAGGDRKTQEISCIAFLHDLDVFKQSI